MGQIYVEVNAEVANNGITTLANSGQISGSYWINWTPAGGFTGQGWVSAWSNTDVCPLAGKWKTNNVPPYENDQTGFEKYIADHPDSNLNTWLSDWDNDDKYIFAHDRVPNIWMDCTTAS